MRENNQIYDEYNKKIVKILDFSNVKHAKNSIKWGYEYIIETPESKLVVKITSKWIGYILTIKPVVLGKKISTFLDTDNYPLDFDKHVTVEIAEETIKCIKGLLANIIFVGKNQKKYYIAVPVNENNYMLEEKSRFIIKKREVSKEELKKITYLQPINSTLRKV